MTKMRSLTPGLLCGLTLLVSILAASPVAAQEQTPGGVPQRGEAVEPVAVAVVNMLEVAAQEALNPPASGPLPRAIHSPLTRPEPGDPTQVADRTYFPSGPVPNVPSPSPAANFNALDDSAITIPPDTMGAVGTTRLLTMLNDNYRVQDKSGTVIATASLNSFWASTGATGVFDPRVLFDSINSRWIVSAVSGAASASSSLLIGVSQGADPAGTFFLFRFDADAANVVWADFPTIGFNKNWIAVGLNMFTNAANAFVEGQLYVMNYPSARGGTNATTKFNGGYFTLQPALTHSSTENSLYIVEHGSSAGGTYNFYAVTGTPAAPAFAQVGATRANPLGGWTQPSGDPLPQSGTGVGINTGDARIGNAVFRNGNVWYTQTIGLPAGGFTRTAVQWVKLDTSGNFVDGGRIDDPTATSINGGAWYAFPSIAVNQNNDVLLGFGRFSSTTFASGAYAFRASGDAAGTMRDPVVYKAGLATYVKTFGGPRNRWGDYSMTTVDPSDDTSFWTIQEYAATPVGAGSTSSRWGTWWAKVDPPPVGPTLTYYFAEGATGSFFDLELALANPNGVSVPVGIQYLKEDGSTVNQSLTLAAQSRQTILVDGIAGLENTAVSSVVTSLNAMPLGVERTMTWDATGYGSHTERATPGAALTWYFAEGSEQAFFDTYLLLANPQSAANRATVQFLIEGGSPVTKVYDLLPTSRTNVYAQDVEEPAGTKVLLDKAFGIVVTFDQPGVAERAMYFGSAPFWNGGHESAGVNAPSTSWFHAEGATGAFFDTFILLSNPNGSPATVTLTFLLDSGGTVTRVKTVPANARLTVGVENEDALLANAAMATQVTSTVPIVSERAMYWAQFPNWYEAHNAFGVTSTAPKWVLGEGRVGGTSAYETYILLANPGATAATVTVTYLREGGLTPIVRVHTVPATSRYNVVPTSDGLGNERFGALIESTVPIAVERAMYSSSSSQPGLFWAAGTDATGTPLP